MDEARLLLEYMENHVGEFMGILKELVLLETPTEGDKEDLKKCRDYFKDLFEGIGFECSVVPSNDSRYGDHLSMELGEGGEQILFVGHYDTVYDKGAFEPLWREEGTRVWGPGVLDMKGGDLMVYFIVRALKELNLMPKDKKIVFFLNSDEEAGSYSSHMHYRKVARQSKAAFVMESTRGDDIGGVKIGRFGRSNYTFIARGKDAHSGQEPENAESALRELAKQAVSLEDLTDLTKAMTVACTSLKSGNGGWPTVPGYGELTVDARFSTAELAKEYDSAFKNLTAFNKNVKITTQGGIEKPPFDEKDPIHKALYEKAVETGKLLGIEIQGYVTRGGSDGNFTASTGCPTLDGLGMSGDFVHQPGKEYINVNHIAKRSAFVALLALRILTESAEGEGI